MTDIKFGARYRDKVTGFEGTAVTRLEHLFGCLQIGLSPKVNEKGELGETIYFDWERLEFVEEGPLEPNQITGGSRRDVPGRQA